MYMQVKPVQSLNVQIFADGADRNGILELYKNPLIKGFTTNPTLMRKAGIQDYSAFAKQILSDIPDRPFSFEVFSDEFDEMEKQARIIATWGENVFVKIPVTNTRKEPAYALIQQLADAGIKLNITAVMPLEQVAAIIPTLKNSPESYISVFAGRIADTGVDPVPFMAQAVEMLRPYPNIKLLWASPRELLNIFQADEIGCDIITVTHDVLKKLSLVGKNLEDYSLETVEMFYNDAKAVNYTISESAFVSV